MNSLPAATSSSPVIQVMRATKQDWPELAEFYAREFNEHPRLNDAKTWQWKILEQPTNSPQVPFFILKVNDRIEGGIGYLSFPMCIGQSTITAIHPVNYFVNPRYKGLPALRLLRAVLQEGDIAIGSNLSVVAQQLLEKSGFIDHSAYFFSYRLLLRITSRSTLRGLLVWVWRRARESLLHTLLQLQHRSLTYHIATKLDNTWLQKASEWPLPGYGIQKSAEYMIWRYARSPLLNCCYIWQLDNGKPAGLAVLHFDAHEKAAVLLDLCAASFESGSFVGLIVAAIQHARSEGMNTFDTHSMSPQIEAALRRTGCAGYASSLGLVLYSRDTTIARTIEIPGHWHFILGDTDRY